MVFHELADKLKDKVRDLYGGEDDDDTRSTSSSSDNEDNEDMNEDDLVESLESNCTGRKKALFIGINYTGTKAELRGCINDVQNISSYMFNNWGFQPSNSVILTDDQPGLSGQPTRHNILKAMDWLVHKARPNDSLFLHYSGHGSHTKDQTGDEADGQDETIVPVDYTKAGMITDDELYDHLVKPLRKGVRLTVIFDCCHSGTILDLPFTYNCDGDVEVHTPRRGRFHALFDQVKLAAGAAIQGNAGAAVTYSATGLACLVRPPKTGEEPEEELARRKAALSTEADVLSFSGCQDSQTSADANIGGQATGALSYALIKALNENPNITFIDLLASMRQFMKRGYSQIPQLSSGRVVNLETPFFL
ncbi:hypothetical protein AMAG_09619 [Allomyces macrogynus ATCC 38327]|uniref:Peptidase C14 caspase domain-containing protein n=1 Tax=Allomyces macrogynus (strain ATCC 38327) TaxID=578462 RepID=A0A0L0ST11_ALLM3|nr:hypothetical protein AMAG_09619 [Allomyces macrogynus ATCC 38327]|eukprot:KNE65636.1 hypothetical protein AMAG_09619 [Allomyces macrogynus ATCC 38327]